MYCVLMRDEDSVVAVRVCVPSFSNAVRGGHYSLSLPPTNRSRLML